jgi:hypothetical protein
MYLLSISRFRPFEVLKLKTIYMATQFITSVNDVLTFGKYVGVAINKIADPAYWVWNNVLVFSNENIRNTLNNQFNQQRLNDMDFEMEEYNEGRDLLGNDFDDDSWDDVDIPRTHSVRNYDEHYDEDDFYIGLDEIS